MSNMPTPTDSGASGTQQGDQVPDVQVESPMTGLPIVTTMEGLAAGHARSMGGEVTAALIVGSFKQMNHNLQEAQKELHDLRNKLEVDLGQLSDHKVKTAVLEERVKSFSRDRNIKNLCITIGMALIGIAIDLFRNNLRLLGVLMVILGVVLLLIGWLSPEGGS